MGAQPEHKPEPSEPIAWIGHDRAPLEPVEPREKERRRALVAFLRTRRGVATAVGLALLVLIGLAIWAGRPGAPAPAAPVAQAAKALPLVTVMQPRLAPVASRVSFTGTIHARFDMPISPEGEGGRLVAVLVEAGDTVRRGQLLARIDDSVLRPQVNRLAAALEEARANAELAEAEYARAKGVEAAGALSAEEIERRRAAAVTAAAQVKVVAAQLAEAQARLERTFIRAPADGLVLTRTAEVGQTAAPGEPLFRLARDGEVEMRGRIAEQDLPLIAVGQPATVRLTGIADPFPGEVRLLGAVIDPQTRLGEIRVALQPHPQLRPGAFARGEVIVSNAERPVLPQTAVLSDPKGTYVYVVNGEDRVERRDVRIADTIPEGVVIAEGLTGEERVVTTAGAFLREGEQVRVAADGAAASRAS